MSFLKKHRYKLIALVFIAAVLVLAFWRGTNAPELPPAENPIEQFSSETEAPAPSETPDNSADDTAQNEEPEAEPPQPVTAYSEESSAENEPVPADKPAPAEPQDAEEAFEELTCTLSVRCDTILDNITRLDAEKAELVPRDGVIFAEQTVVFYEGESVFNLLLREMKKNKIHLEFENTPMYDSAYIEGIGNLYEYDCGELSGWMYKVNGQFPNYGCSKYLLKAGDKVEWVYTCDLGADVGGNYAASGE